MEGVICDRGLNLGHLIGVLHQFFERLGMGAQLRFKPAYNPYTEPSMEVFSFHPMLNKWVEVGNSGMFRPEMLRPMAPPVRCRRTSRRPPRGCSPISPGRAAGSQVVPGMERATVQSFLSAQDMIANRKGSFDLYGLDFVLDKARQSAQSARPQSARPPRSRGATLARGVFWPQDLNPWLLEINASPSMEHSTPITARLCTAVAEDTIKVVVDMPEQREARIAAGEADPDSAGYDTGLWRLIHKCGPPGCGGWPPAPAAALPRPTVGVRTERRAWMDSQVDGASEGTHVYRGRARGGWLMPKQEEERGLA